MPIISSIGRKAWRTQVLIWGIVLLLLAGAATMVLPFLLMASGSVASGVDGDDPSLFPKFVRNDDLLYRKYVEGLFNESLSTMQVAYDTDTRTFAKVRLPAVSDVAVKDWRTFQDAAALPWWSSTIGFVYTPLTQTDPHLRYAFKEQLKAEFDGDIVAMNRALETEFANWNAFLLFAEDYLSRRSLPLTTEFGTRRRAFTQEQDRVWRYTFSVEGFYRQRFLKARYGGDVAAYNAAHGTTYGSMQAVPVPERVPAGELAAAEWDEFVREVLNLVWVRVAPEQEESFRGYLKARYAKVGALNTAWKGAFASFDAIPLIAEPPEGGTALTDWEAWIQGWTSPDTGDTYRVPTEALRLVSVEGRFREWLGTRYPTVAAVNAAWGMSYATLEAIPIPQAMDHYVSFVEREKELRSEFLVRNYRTVFDYLLLQGRGIFNTVIYCLLAVLSALIVNPLAAYALSRYRPRATYKILLFMLLTMAFPPMVTQIPVFLMLRDFGLLNSFWALILPGMASGYSIFLLKGFFDSLPRELYESASIDGAGEWTMFWRITMNLSKPILAVVGLAAFTAAYTNFMFALLICQDEQMWTLMVWLYQLQQTKGEAVVYASLLVAAVPTFLIFLFCQNIIMRGIVVPAEK